MLNTHFIFRNSDFTTLNPLFICSHCLLKPYVYSNTLICQNDIHPRPGLCPKSKIGLFSYNPQLLFSTQPTVYSSSCLFTPDVHSNLLISQNGIYLNKGIWPKPKIGWFTYTYLSTHFTTLNPLFIYTASVQKILNGFQIWHMELRGFRINIALITSTHLARGDDVRPAIAENTIRMVHIWN